MPVYSITYDLKAPGRNYDFLYEEIMALGDWAHYLESAWFVDTSLSAYAIQDILVSVIDKNDSLFISLISSDFSGWLEQEAWDWLKERIKI